MVFGVIEEHCCVFLSFVFAFPSMSLGNLIVEQETDRLSNEGCRSW